MSHPADSLILRALRGESANWAGMDSECTSEEFVKRCEHHGVISYLYQTLRAREDWVTWPEDVQVRAQIAGNASIATEMIRLNSLQKLMKSLKANRVRFLIMKGEALAKTHYVMPGTRLRYDSDLFISTGDINKARSAVNDIGFNVISPVYKSHQFTVTPSGERSGAPHFDIHWRILNNPSYARVMPFGEVYENSIEVPELGGARVPNSIHSLMLACMHRFGSEKHDRDRLIWILDIHLLVTGLSQQALDEFARTAVERDVQAACLSGLLKSREDFYTDIPDSVFSILQIPNSPANLSGRFQNSNLGLLLDDWKTLPDLRSRLGLLRELFFPSAQFMLERYSKESKLWLPILWVRQVVGGVYKRLLLK